MKFTCSCCGHRVFEDRVCWEVCKVCFWEDDPIQAADPWYRGGANRPNLVEAQETYLKIGAMEERFLELVRSPEPDEPKDPGWRPIVASDREFSTTPREIEDNCTKREEQVSYYYWLRADV